MPIIEESSNWDGFSRAEPQYAAFEYDFAVDAGGAGVKTLRGEAIPSGAIVTDSLVYLVTPPTSGGSATVSLGLEGAADLLAATAFNAAPFAAAGAKHGLVTATSDPVVTTAARKPTATIAVAALTAGKLVVILTYLIAKG